MSNDTTQPADQDAAGRFAPGNKANKGNRGPRRRARRLTDLIWRAATGGTLRETSPLAQIAKKFVEDAVTGGRLARRDLIEMFAGRATAAQDKAEIEELSATIAK